MSSERYPRMDYLIGAYFNQGFGLLWGNTIPEVVSRYKGNSPSTSHLETIEEIDAFMREHPTDLDAAFEKDYGEGLDPKWRGHTARSFLEELKWQLSEAQSIVPWRYSRLNYLLEVYLSQDSGFSGKTVPEIVARYRKESPRDEHLELVSEIDAFIAEHPDDLDSAFDEEYGRAFDPSQWGHTIASFLAETRRLLADEEGEIMPSERYPRMGLIFGVHFGQDFDLFGNTIPEIVSSYKNDCPEYRNLPRELDAFTAEHPDDLDAAFKEDFGSGFDPKLWGHTTASFFEEIKRLLRE